MKKYVMTEELKRIRDDVLSNMKKFRRQSKSHNDPQHDIARILAMVAGAVQEGRTEGLATHVLEWGRSHLQNWKKMDERPSEQQQAGRTAGQPRARKEEG